MIGEHSVVFIPDPDVQSWGPVLNSNAYMTTDLAGWTNYAGGLTPPWTWGAGGYAVGTTDPTKSSWIVRAADAPIPRGTSTLFRVRFRFSVAQACSPTFGIFYADTAQHATDGPFWAPPGSASMVEDQVSCPTAGSYVAELVHDPSTMPPEFLYLAPEMHWGRGDNPVVDSIELWGQGSDLIDLSCLVDQVSIHHGRDDVDSQPEASSATIDLSVDTGSGDFPPAVEVGGLIRVTTTTPGTQSVRFVGRVTDIVQGWDEAGENTPNAALAQVIATGILADLGRRIVGDAPFPQELDGARIARIMSLAGSPLDPNTSDPGTVQILPRDVDSQPALDVAQSTAESAGGILWTTRGGAVRYADADHRRGSTARLVLDACDVLVTPSWRRTSEGLINAVSIGYGIPATDGGDQPRYTAQRDDSISAYGLYAFTTTTELAAEADAEAMGQLLLTRNRVPVWIMSALPVDVEGLSEADTNTLLSLDLHDLVSLTGLPVAGNVPSSAFLWVEGWTERLAWRVHEIEVVVSGYCRTSPAPRWNDLSTDQTWDAMGTTATWDDMTCLGPLPNRGRWDDVPASSRWDAVPPYVTWDTYTI